MTIFDVLVAQQEAIAGLFARTHDAAEAGELDRARDLFAQLSSQLLGMMRAEHSVVYPMLSYNAGLGDEVAEALRDHRQIERAVNRLRLAPLDAETWRKELVALRSHLLMHVDLEELTLFPLARLRLTLEEMHKLAADFLAIEPVATSVAGASITYELPSAA